MSRHSSNSRRGGKRLTVGKVKALTALAERKHAKGGRVVLGGILTLTSGLIAATVILTQTDFFDDVRFHPTVFPITLLQSAVAMVVTRSQVPELDFGPVVRPAFGFGVAGFGAGFIALLFRRSLSTSKAVFTDLAQRNPPPSLEDIQVDQQKLEQVYRVMDYTPPDAAVTEALPQISLWEAFTRAREVLILVFTLLMSSLGTVAQLASNADVVSFALVADALFLLCMFARVRLHLDVVLVTISFERLSQAWIQKGVVIQWKDRKTVAFLALKQYGLVTIAGVVVFVALLLYSITGVALDLEFSEPELPTRQEVAKEVNRRLFNLGTLITNSGISLGNMVVLSNVMKKNLDFSKRIMSFKDMMANGELRDRAMAMRSVPEDQFLRYVYDRHNALLAAYPRSEYKNLSAESSNPLAQKLVINRGDLDFFLDNQVEEKPPSGFHATLVLANLVYWMKPHFLREPAINIDTEKVRKVAAAVQEVRSTKDEVDDILESDV